MSGENKASENWQCDRGRRGGGGDWIHYVEEGDDDPLLGFANEINLRRNYNNYTILYSDFNLR
jgi:hypothetical protein